MKKTTILIGTSQALTFVNSNNNNNTQSTKNFTGETPWRHSAWIAKNKYGETLGPRWTSHLRTMEDNELLYLQYEELI
jgi:hypothetical protein